MAPSSTSMTMPPPPKPPASATFTLRARQLRLDTYRGLTVWGTAFLFLLLNVAVLEALSSRGSKVSDSVRVFYVLPVLGGFVLWWISDIISLRTDHRFSVDKQGVSFPGFLFGSEKRITVPAADIVSIWTMKEKRTMALKSVHLAFRDGRRVAFAEAQIAEDLDDVLAALTKILPANSPFRSAQGIPPEQANPAFLPIAIVVLVVGVIAVTALTNMR